MPKIAKKLSRSDIEELRHSGKGSSPERHAVGNVPGLMIQVTPNNAKSWILRASIGGKRREIGLGSYQVTSFEEARKKAAEMQLEILAGNDPLKKRNTKKEDQQKITFKQAMEEYLDHKLTEFKNDKHKKQWRSTLENYALHVIGKKHVDDIDVHDVLDVLKPIWSEKTETASRLRGRIEKILAYSTVMKHRKGDNPARWEGNLSEALPAPGRIRSVKHRPAVNWIDAPIWYSKLSQRSGMSVKALQFLALTACRSGEVRGARWDEIDFATFTWNIPGSRMKMGKDYVVPLSPQAFGVLPSYSESNSYIFPSATGVALSDMALSEMMRDIHAAELKAGREAFIDRLSKKQGVPHGLRSTFRDWCYENTNFQRDIVEACLAHTVGKVEAAYRRGSAIDKRRVVINAWGAFLTGGK